MGPWNFHQLILVNTEIIWWFLILKSILWANQRSLMEPCLWALRCNQPLICSSSLTAEHCFVTATLQATWKLTKFDQFAYKKVVVKTKSQLFLVLCTIHIFILWPYNTCCDQSWTTSDWSGTQKKVEGIACGIQTGIPVGVITFASAYFAPSCKCAQRSALQMTHSARSWEQSQLYIDPDYTKYISRNSW